MSERPTKVYLLRKESYSPVTPITFDDVYCVEQDYGSGLTHIMYGKGDTYSLQTSDIDTLTIQDGKDHE